jgi:hypothetical protein
LLRALQDAAKRQAREQDAARRINQTGGLLWELVKNGAPWAETLYVRSERQGWDIVITRNGQRSHSRQFSTRDRAEAWAD